MITEKDKALLERFLSLGKQTGKPQLTQIYCDSEIAKILEREKQNNNMESFEVINYKGYKMQDQNESLSGLELLEDKLSGGVKRGDMLIISGGTNNIGKSTLGMFSDTSIEDLDPETPVVIRDDSDLWLESVPEQSDNSDFKPPHNNYFKNYVFRGGNNRYHQTKTKTKRLKKISKKSKQRNRK